MKGKKRIVLLLILSMVFALFGCGKGKENKMPDENSSQNITENSGKNQSANSAQKEKEKIDLQLMALKGPTSLGLLKVFEDNEEGKTKNQYGIHIASSPDEVVAAISKGEFDLTALPANLAAILYNKTEGKGVKVLNINTLGVLYIASQEDFSNLEELRGRTLITSGKGATPEIALRHVLAKNGIDPDRDLTIDFKSEHGEVLAALNQDPQAVVMLPQPFLTVALKKVEGLKVNFSINDLWKEAEDQSELITGVLVANPKTLEEHPEAIASFMEEYRASVDFVNTNVEEGAKLAQKFEIIEAGIAKEAIPHCNITYIDGNEMKTALSGYLQTLYVQDPKAVGGKLPDDNFYFEK